MKGINRSGRGFGKTREPSKCWAAVRDKAGLGEWLRASLIKNLVKNLPAMQETPQFDSWVGKIPWRRNRLPTPGFWPGEFHGIAESQKELSDFQFNGNNQVSLEVSKIFKSSSPSIIFLYSTFS